MPGLPLEKPLTLPEFAEWEGTQLDKHAFLDGVGYAMAGGSPRHNKIAARIAGIFERVLQGGPCEALESNQRIVVNSASGYVYADASVVCGDIEIEPTGQALANPTVLVEVLSKRTEAFDRGDKFQMYRARPSLRDYLMVSQQTARIEHYQCRSGLWTLVNDAEIGSSITLADGYCFPVDDVYAGVWRFPSD